MEDRSGQRRQQGADARRGRELFTILVILAGLVLSWLTQPPTGSLAVPKGGLDIYVVGGVVLGLAPWVPECWRDLQERLQRFRDWMNQV